jgi:hypothetical protein
MLLTTLDELDAVLGTRFIILAGSAISGVDAPHLPMVNQFTCEVLRATESIVPTDIYREALGAAYARGLTRGRYAPLRAATKFEQFLEHLANTTSTKKVNALLAGVFTCGPEEYGTSHAAIAELLRIDACAACLTTNFDNALERALERSTPPQLFVTRQPSAADMASGHVLYKLHGDASTGSCDFRASDLAKKGREASMNIWRICWIDTRFS